MSGRAMRFGRSQIDPRPSVCLKLRGRGERLYSQETVRRFEEIRAKLKRQETAEFKPMGLSFEVV
jgi:hypothetical protein